MLTMSKNKTKSIKAHQSLGTFSSSQTWTWRLEVATWLGPSPWASLAASHPGSHRGRLRGRSPPCDGFSATVCTHVYNRDILLYNTLHTYLSVCLSACLSVRLSISMCIYIYICVCVFLCNI